jgi:DNA-binding NarL/FixJ family response regulator
MVTLNSGPGVLRAALDALLRGACEVPTIAKGLDLSASTARNHLSKIYRKVGVHSQVELIEALQDATGRPL